MFNGFVCDSLPNNNLVFVRKKDFDIYVSEVIPMEKEVRVYFTINLIDDQVGVALNGDQNDDLLMRTTFDIIKCHKDADKLFGSFDLAWSVDKWVLVECNDCFSLGAVSDKVPGDLYANILIQRFQQLIKG